VNSETRGKWDLSPLYRETKSKMNHFPNYWSGVGFEAALQFAQFTAPNTILIT